MLCVPAAGAARGGQGALGEQLPLLLEEVQPRCLVKSLQPQAVLCPQGGEKGAGCGEGLPWGILLCCRGLG